MHPQELGPGTAGLGGVKSTIHYPGQREHFHVVRAKKKRYFCCSLLQGDHGLFFWVTCCLDTWHDVTWRRLTREPIKKLSCDLWVVAVGENFWDMLRAAYCTHPLYIHCSRTVRSTIGVSPRYMFKSKSLRSWVWGLIFSSSRSGQVVVTVFNG